jgi:signal transduction histidine kinase
VRASDSLPATASAEPTPIVAHQRLLHRLLDSWRLVLAVLAPAVVLIWVQLASLYGSQHPLAQSVSMARALEDGALSPPEGLASAPVRHLPLTRADPQGTALWLQLDLPRPERGDELWAVALSYRPAVRVYLNGALLADTDPGAYVTGSGSGHKGQFVLGQRELQLSLPAGALLGEQPQLQVRLAAPGSHHATLSPVLVGPVQALKAAGNSAENWAWLRSITAGAGVLVAMFLGLVAWVRREEPLYALSAAHVALLALLLMPYVLPSQPLPSPWWRMLLDAADLIAKALLLVLMARWVGVWGRGLQRALLVLLAIGLPWDAWAAWHNLGWSNFNHPWPWWALGSRALLLGGALALALGALLRRHHFAAWGNAVLVSLSVLTWTWVSLASLVLRVPVVDSNALAHAGWVLWVALLLQRHFVDGARRDAGLRQHLAQELAQRSAALEAAHAARARAEREQAAAEQRQQLLQDLHDGLGARLLTVRLQASTLSPDALVKELDACLLEMRLSVDSLTETRGDLGVLLGSWRHRVTKLLQHAGLEMDWRVIQAPELPCLRGNGALELVRWLQEALSNTLRHAEAKRLIVATEVDATHLTLWWVDDGVGLSPTAHTGCGRAGLAARAKRLGGSLQVISPAPRMQLHEGVGTALALRLPLH